jgi:hypothetical protein
MLGHGGPFAIAPGLNFEGDIFRDVLRPVLKRIEGDDARRESESSLSDSTIQSTHGLRAKVLVALWGALPTGCDGREFSLADAGEQAQTLLRAAADVVGLRSTMQAMEDRLAAVGSEEAEA